MIRNLDQKRAIFSLNFIQGFKGDGSKLSTHIHKTPVRILQNGLGQALAFLLADDEGKHTKPSHDLYSVLQEWLCGTPDEHHPRRVYEKPDSLMRQLVEGSRDQYLQAQNEALSLFNWLKKFAEAYLSQPVGS